MGFAAIILLGALLLSLPIAWAPGHQIKFIDCPFTSTTSICVTGLVTESTYAAWSGFGHVVILFLIQLGGFGVITCGTLVVLAMGKRVSIRNRRLIQESYNLDTLKGLIALVRKIVLGTLLVEGVGMVFYSFQFVPEFGIQRDCRRHHFPAARRTPLRHGILRGKNRRRTAGEGTVCTDLRLHP